MDEDSLEELLYTLRDIGWEFRKFSIELPSENLDQLELPLIFLSKR